MIIWFGSFFLYAAVTNKFSAFSYGSNSSQTATEKAKTPKGKNIAKIKIRKA